MAAWLAHARPTLRVTATDRSAAAAASARETAEVNALADRIHVTQADGLELLADASEPLIVLNPPFHSDAALHTGIAAHLFEDAARVLAPGGELWCVWNSHLRYRPLLERLVGPTRQVARNAKFTVTASTRSEVLNAARAVYASDGSLSAVSPDRWSRVTMAQAPLRPGGTSCQSRSDWHVNCVSPPSGARSSRSTSRRSTCADGLLVALEALSRWRHPDARVSHRASSSRSRRRRGAMDRHRRCHARGGLPVRSRRCVRAGRRIEVAVNVAAAQLSEARFAERVTNHLRGVRDARRAADPRTHRDAARARRGCRSSWPGSARSGSESRSTTCARSRRRRPACAPCRSPS